MNIFLPGLIFLTAIFIGAIIGYVFGFARTAHPDIMLGVRPKSTNRLLLLMARPTSSLKFVEGIVFTLVMFIWVPIFFGLCAVPGILAYRFGFGERISPEILYGVFVVVAWLASFSGAKAWRAMV